MKKYLLQFILSCIVVSGITQEKVAAIDPGKNFSTEDHSIGYYNPFENKFRITLQNGNVFTRFLYDSNFNLADSFSFKSKAISFNYRQNDKYYFLTNIILEGGNYEIYTNGEKIFFREPDFKERKDKIAYEHTIKQTEDDERLLAVFPGRNEIKILSASFDKDKLFLYSWSPSGNIVKSGFDLPESNITDAKQKKEIPKEARIKFRNYLTNLSVQPLKQTTPFGRSGATLYYSNDVVYILLPTPYNLGVYLIRLDLHSNEFKGTNYFVNTLKDNAADNVNFHKSATGILYDTVLIIKNASDRVYEYYFYTINTGKQVKKYSSVSYELKDLIHSEMKQKGSWGSANEEKDIDNYKRFVRKGGTGMIFAASVSADSITITNLALQATTGIEGAILDFAVRMPLAMSGIPSYATALIPSLGISRNKIIYAHSRFSIKDWSLSKSTGVTTILDELLDERNAETISGSSSFFIRKDETWFLGYYSGKSKKIEVYKYDGNK
jgi:hypothetical protein